MQAYSDQEILNAVVHSIEERDQAIRWLYKDIDFRNKTFGVIRKIINEKWRKEESVLFDIFEEGLMEFIRLVGQGKFQKKSSVHTFIIGICKYKSLEYNRKFANHLVEKQELVDKEGNHLDIKSDWETAEENFIKMESGLEAIIQEVIQKVSQHCQEILRRYLFEEQSVKTMAGELDSSIQTIKNARSKCRKQLRTLIKNHPHTPQRIKNME